jgi:hypothetical protein
MAINCAYSSLCPEVADPAVFGKQYVGHDGPSLLFYSNKRSGNRMQYPCRA